MQKNLKTLRFRMRCVRIFHYFRRNNPRYTNCYYYRFIEIVGPEKYLCSPLVRNEWDGARYSFDKMYGLVSAWHKSFDIIKIEDYTIGEIRDYLNSLFLQEINALKSHCDSIQKDLYVVVKNAEAEESKKVFEAFLKLKNSIDDLERKEKYKAETELLQFTKEIRNVEKIIELYKQISEFSNSEKDFAVKKLKEIKSKQEQQSKNEENKKEEKKDGLSVDVQADTANTPDTLPA